MRELTGIRIAESGSAGELHVDISNRESPYTKSLPPKFAYGTDVNVADIVRWYDHQLYLKDPRDPALRRDLPGFRISPRFYSDDPGAKILGTMAGLNRPGLVVKRQPGGWTSIYSGAPILPAPLLRSIALAAGCHIYSDANDVVYANRNVLSIYAPHGGTRTVHLREKAKVTDLLTHKTVAGPVKDFPLVMEAGDAVLLGVE